jgi:hypothetical protein
MGGKFSPASRGTEVLACSWSFSPPLRGGAQHEFKIFKKIFKKP